MRRAPRVVVVAAFALAAGCGGSAPSAPGLVGRPSRGSVSLRFTDTANANVALSHVPANQVTVIFNDPTLDTVVALYVAGWFDEGGGSYTKSWDMVIDVDGPPVEGMVYQLGDQLVTPGQAVMSFMDDSGEWKASSGTITVTSIVGATVTFTFQGVTMIHAGPPGTPGTQFSMGSFSLSGVVTINDINDVCDCIG
jgi:hypothetical protein